MIPELVTPESVPPRLVTPAIVLLNAVRLAPVEEPGPEPEVDFEFDEEGERSGV